MQVSFCLYWRLLIDFAYFKESIANAVQVASFTRKKRHLNQA